MLRSNEDGLAGDSIHVEADARLEVVQVDEAVLGDEVDDAVLLGHLHGHGEIVRCLSGEEDVDCLLGEHRVRGIVVDFDNVELMTQEERKIS